MLTKPTTAKQHYAIVFETTQLIGDKKRVREVPKILVSVINVVPVNESTKSTYAFGDEASEEREASSENERIKEEPKLRKKRKAIQYSRKGKGKVIKTEGKVKK